MNEHGALKALNGHLFRAGAAHPFLREPIEAAPRVVDDAIPCLATDGARIYYNPDAAPEGESVAHLLIHCLFRHLPPGERAARSLWDLACDMCAEYLRTELFPSADAKLTRRRVTDALPESTDPRLPAAVYKALADLFEDELDALSEQFRRDDHRYWYAPHPAAERLDGAGERSYREWVEEAVADRWPAEDDWPGGAPVTGRFGLAPGSRQERMLLREEGKHDFSRYLRRFSTTREELRLDLGCFDYIPYCYGLARYGNLPLIEPLEYAESHRVEELVIAIDTSGSCARPVVERFLSEIQNILMRHEYFFRRMNVHIIQCDAVIQSHAAIHSIEDWRKYTKDIVIKGRGGTNFTPVFELVEKLRQRGVLKRLRGLIYFTDGDGVYPREAPPYETAFVFSTRKALDFKLPDWIIPLCLERGDESYRGTTP